ncbi:MAG: GTP 3',8-cyclase MoaA [Rhodospirillaceae bacterium]|nr:MAG: GTP 3',8-cyclase MoaA [Rhodospirillaceae bacterium]
MQDTFGRPITYLRVSVTDRCDFRCFYCMPEAMTFLPRSELLSLEELDEVCSTFVERGVTKVRLTGGEPLLRRGIMDFIKGFSRHLDSGALDELTLTTNASQLSKHAHDLKALGVERINVSLDTLDADKFKEITRTGRLDQVIEGLDAASSAGLKVKINTVALKDYNEGELSQLVKWCGERGFDLTLIETMPLGDIGGDRTESYLPLDDVRKTLDQDWTLTPSPYNTGGPSRYVDVKETGQRIGFITPLSEHFCDTCNRMRLTCTGTLYMCLGQDSSVNLRDALRSDASKGALNAAIDKALTLKPKGHEFEISANGGPPSLKRHMNVTGG